jgi:multisubunit Na+/H+ antiporter MnhE subunit
VRARPLLAAWLLVAWLALSRRVDLTTVALGIAATAAILATLPPGPRRWLRPVPAARLAGLLAADLVVASLAIAREALSPRDRIAPAILTVPLVGASGGSLAVVGWAVGLVPGTSALELSADPPALLVHAMYALDAEAVRRDVQRIEALAIRAFGSPDAVRALELRRRG